jgi:peptidylprolyl isomerase
MKAAGAAASGALLVAFAGAALLGGRPGDGSHDLHLPRPVDPRMQMSVVTIARGHGLVAREGHSVRVRYEGKPPSSAEPLDAGSSLDFVLGAGEVIEGWDEAIVGMKVGEKRRLVIPPAMAYGSRGRAGVMPGETLVYEVELLAVLEEADGD